MKISEILTFLEGKAPLAYQEDYDNSGLQCGNRQTQITGILICLDVTENVVREAKEKKCNLILSHHPVIFSPLRKITPDTTSGRVLTEAIRNDITIYSLHTNFDVLSDGINHTLSQKLGLQNLRVTLPKKGLFKKIVTFCPVKDAEKVRNALFVAGAGHIGEYDECSYNLDGTGTFRASDQANPYVGKKGKRHSENETRIETVFPVHAEKKIISAFIGSHPYEEVAYDIYPISNKATHVGFGLTGTFKKPVSPGDLVKTLKKILGIPFLKTSNGSGRKIKTVCICSGSGSFLLPDVIAGNTDALITADCKYHAFQEAGKNTFLVDTGHYETEIFFKEVLYNLLIKNFTTFALHKSKKDLNPVIYS